jgi:hypothetical protein
MSRMNTLAINHFCKNALSIIERYASIVAGGFNPQEHRLFLHLLQEALAVGSPLDLFPPKD